MNSKDYKEELAVLDDMHQIYSLLHIALNRIQAQADSCLENITSRQLMLLMAIMHLKHEEATIVNIAGILGTSKQNVTRLVSSMIRSGYLASKPGEKDKRSVNISITKSGMEVMQQTTIHSNVYFLHLFQDFSREELKILRAMLEKLNKYDSQQKYFEEKADIDIGKNSPEMENFLGQLHDTFLRKEKGGNDGVQ